MREYRADLHIHTLLSPCGDLEMSPQRIVDRAAKEGLDIIGITDHNSTRHCRLAMEAGKEQGIFILAGSEVNTKEEVHCLTFFENLEQLDSFQLFLDENLGEIQNDPRVFGFQVQIDRDELIVYEEEKLLVAALKRSLTEVEDKVRELDGIFIPAHIDRPQNGLFSQLGFMPAGMHPDGLEIFRNTDPEKLLTRHPELKDHTLIKSSDAHFLKDIGRASSRMTMKEISFDEIRKALHRSDGRRIEIT